MGYTTNFTGQFNLSPTLTPEHKAYLTQFAEIRHMRRNPSKTAVLDDPLREAVGLPIGGEGDYYVGTANKFDSQGVFGVKDESIIDGNSPPSSQPGLWCQWVPTVSGEAIVWDDGEKFYEYVDWIRYLVDHFLTPWGYLVAGIVYWEGEESGDLGRIIIDSPNVVRVENAFITYR
jgi:hypothetical protein